MCHLLVHWLVRFRSTPAAHLLLIPVGRRPTSVIRPGRPTQGRMPATTRHSVPCHVRADKRRLGFFRGTCGARLEQERGIPDPLLPVHCCDLPTCRRFWTWRGIVQAISAPRLLSFTRSRQRSRPCLLVMGDVCRADNILGSHFSVAIYRWRGAPFRRPGPDIPLTLSFFTRARS